MHTCSTLMDLEEMIVTLIGDYSNTYSGVTAAS